jgi:hypothetical protein
VSKAFEYNISTTRISTTDDQGRAVPDIPVTIATSTYTSCYVSNVFYGLTPSRPLTFRSDYAGEITIVSKVDSLELAPFTVKLSGIATDSVTVDPLVKSKVNLLRIKDESRLADVQVRLDNGNVLPLLPSTVTNKQRTAAATTLVQLGELSQQPDPNSGKKRGEPGDDQPPLTFAIDFGDPDFAYYDGEDQVNELLSNKRKKRNVEDVELFGDLAEPWFCF